MHCKYLTSKVGCTHTEGSRYITGGLKGSGAGPALSRLAGHHPNAQTASVNQQSARKLQPRSNDIQVSPRFSP